MAIVLGLLTWVAPLGADQAGAVPIPSACFTPAGIDGTGTTDVTVQLNALFSSVPDGGCVSFPRPSSFNPGRYRVSDTVRIDNKIELRIFGNGATIFLDRHPEGHGPLFLVQESRGVLVENLKLTGVEEDCVYQQSPTEYEAGVQIMWSENVTIDRITATRHSGDGAFVGWGVGKDGWAHGQTRPDGSIAVVPKSKNIQILNSTFDCVARQGVAFGWVDGVLIENTSWDRAGGDSAIDLEHFAVDNFVARGNHFGRVSGWLFIGQVPGDNWHLLDNVSTEPIYMLVRHSSPAGVVIEGNVGGGIAGGDYATYGPASPFLVVQSGGEYRITGNHQQFASHMRALDLRPPQAPPPGGSFQGITGVCTAHAEANEFADAYSLWRKPSYFPAGCSWTDVNNSI